MLRLRQQQEQWWADDAMGDGPDDGTGKEAEGFLRSQGILPPSAAVRRTTPLTSWVVQRTGMPLIIVLPEVGGKGVRGSKRSQGRDFTPERPSAHVLGFRPPPVTSNRVAQRTGAMPLPMGQPEVRGIEDSGADLAQQQWSSHCNRTKCQPGQQRCRTRLSSQQASREQPS